MCDFCVPPGTGIGICKHPTPQNRGFLKSPFPSQIFSNNSKPLDIGSHSLATSVYIHTPYVTCAVTLLH